MDYKSLNHIQGKNGSRWTQFIRGIGTENLLMVAIDAAKYTHKALISTFYGEVLVKPFEFDASTPGLELIKQKIKAEKDRYNMIEVVVGIETTGHYYEDLVLHCQLEGFHVRTINAATTAEERRALLNWSKTDNLDLLAILQSMIHGRGTFNELPTGKVHNLQKLTRARRELVNERSAIKNLILVHMDHIFREFQGKTVWIDGKKEKIKPLSDNFGKASRYLMRYYPHPSDILELGEQGLRDLSVRENLKLRDSCIQCLLEFAKESISKPKEKVETDIFLLAQRLDQLDFLTEQIKVLERKIEDLFVQTEGGLLLSVPGIGVVTGAEFFAEMGDISDYSHAGQLIKMAGTNPIVKQSGDRRPSYFAISKQGRKQFRNITYHVGKSLAINNPKMNQKYHELIDRGKKSGQAYIALGNRMIRLAFSMIRNQTLYQTDEEKYVLYDEVNKKLHKVNVEHFFENFVVSPVSHPA